MSRAESALAAASALRFEERNPWEKGFAQVFDEEVLPALVMLEQRRWRAKQSAQTRTAVSLVIWFVLLAGCLWSLTWSRGEAPAFACGWSAALFSGIFVSVWASVPASEYEAGRKAVLGPVVARFLDGLHFNAEGIPASKLWETGLFGNGRDGRTADRLSGRVAGHAFEFCEAKLTRSAGKSTQQVFDGWVMNLEVAASPGQWAWVAVGERRLAPGLFLDTGWTEGEIWHRVQKRVWLRGRVAAPPPELIEALIAFEAEVQPYRVEAIFQTRRLWLFVRADTDRFVPDGVHEDALHTDDLRRFLADAWHLRELARRLASGVLGVEREA